MSKYLLTLSLLLSSLLVQGQGWERIYSGGAQDEALDVALTPDGGYVLTGYYNINSRISLIKVDADGFQQWSKFFPGNPKANGSAVVVTRDSGYVVGGYIGGAASGARDAYLLKTDDAGNLLWAKTFGQNGDDEILDLIELPDGSFVMSGYKTNLSGDRDVRVLKADANGNLLWSKTFGLPNRDERANSLALADNGDLVLVGEQNATTVQDIYTLRLTSEGEQVWEKIYSLAANIDDGAQAVVATADGNFVLTGFTQTSAAAARTGLLMKISGAGADVPVWFHTFTSAETFYDVTLDGNGGFLMTGYKPVSAALQDLAIVRTDDEGSFIWESFIGKAGPDSGNAVLATPDGGSVAVGYSQPDFGGQATYSYMVRTDASGRVFTNYLQGVIFNDLNSDGVLQLGEARLKNWLLKVSSPDFVRYVTTDNAGAYSVMVDTGNYNITLYTPNDYWQPSPASNLNVAVTEFYDTAQVNIGAVAAFTCPRNEVDVQTPILHRCADNLYTVRYCNTGTTPSTNTQVSVVLSSDLTLTGASRTYTQVGDTAYFNIGTLLPGNCGSFTFNAFLDCDAAVGSAHCARAYVTPDTFCSVSGNWDNAVIEAIGRCVDGQVRLSLRNRGTGSIGNTLEYVIIEDIVMLTIPPGTIEDMVAGQEIVVFNENANGKTYRLIAEQTEGYPGMSVPTVAVEGCTTDTTINVSTGFFTMFPEDDAEPFAAADCQEAYEPDYNPILLKRGHPKGYDTLGATEPRHYILANTDLDYLIRFQNTTGDTVHQVIIRDTLSPWLRPESLRSGSASHAYDFELYGTGIAKFTLSNLNLAPGGEGYVKFRIAQQPDIPGCGTEIFNQAAIYFDAAAPAVTNQTLHTVCDSLTFVTVQTQDIAWPGANLRVFPNPFAEQVTFEISGVRARTFQLEIYDVQGRTLFNRVYTDSTFQLWRHEIPSGLHFYRLAADGRPVASGKLLAQPR